MHLLEIECLGKMLRLEGSMAGWQQLFWGEQCVSQINANADSESFLHQFTLKTDSEGQGEAEDGEQGELQVELNGSLQWQPFDLQFKLINQW